VVSTDLLVLSAICYSIFGIINIGLVIYYTSCRFQWLKELLRCGTCKNKKQTVRAGTTNITDDSEMPFSTSFRLDYHDVNTTDVTVTEDCIPEAVNYTEFRELLLENDYPI